MIWPNSAGKVDRLNTFHNCWLHFKTAVSRRRKFGRHDTQHNDIKCNDTQNSAIQHNDTQNNI